MNKRRASNRARSSASGQAYGPGPVSGGGSYGTPNRSSGSPNHTERIHKGPRAGAGELGHIHQEPGPASRRVKFRQTENSKGSKPMYARPVNRSVGHEEED